jgi:hypothetical protein
MNRVQRQKQLEKWRQVLDDESVFSSSPHFLAGVERSGAFCGQFGALVNLGLCRFLLMI